MVRYRSLYILLLLVVLKKQLSALAKLIVDQWPAYDPPHPFSTNRINSNGDIINIRVSVYTFESFASMYW